MDGDFTKSFFLSGLNQETSSRKIVNGLKDLVLGAGLEPACLSAYAPQTYVSAIPPPEQVSEGVNLPQNVPSRKSAWRVKCLSFQVTSRPMSILESKTEPDWIKVDLHIHTLDDPKDVIDYSAHQLLERAKQLGFGVLAITLHDAVFDRAEVFADASAMGILLISAAEMRREGADIILLNVSAEEISQLQTFDDVRRLRARRGLSMFTIAPHPFYVLGGSIGDRLTKEIDCFDGIELCHFHKGVFDLNRRALKVAAEFNKPLIATSDAHQLHAFGRHYTSVPRPRELTIENVFAALRNGPRRVISPPASIVDLVSMIYFFFFTHPVRIRRQRSCATALESTSQT